MAAPVLHASASPSEWAAGLLSDAKVEALTQHFKAAGFCCVGDVIPASALDAARERLDFDAAHQALGMKYKERGPASGAGLCLALACDVRVACAAAPIGITFVGLGLHPGMGATHFLPRLVGPQAAARLILTGDVVKGDEALRLGMVAEVRAEREISEIDEAAM